MYSHQTALSLHDLSEVNPAKLHMTVPGTFRKKSEIPGILVLHYDNLPDSDVEVAAGYRFTGPLRTILDVIASGEVELRLMNQAVRQAFERGLITKRQIRSTPMSGTARKIIDGALRRVA